MIVSMIKELGRRMGTQSENLKVLTELENVKESQKEVKNTLGGINSRLSDSEEWISELEEGGNINHCCRMGQKKKKRERKCRQFKNL